VTDAVLEFETDSVAVSDRLLVTDDVAETEDVTETDRDLVSL
jgi:hypothetical protein